MCIGLGTVLMPAGHYQSWDPFNGEVGITLDSR